MLSFDLAAVLREAVKAALEGDPLHTAYHAGDARNRHDVWTPILDDKGGSVFVDGIEQREQGEPIFTDAGGDIDAILAHFSAPDDEARRVWLPAVRSDLVREAVDLDELVATSQATQAKLAFLLGAGVLDFTATKVRETFTNLGPATRAALEPVATRMATRLDALDLAPAGEHHVSAFPPAIDRVDVFDALYEQLADTVRKR